MRIANVQPCAGHGVCLGNLDTTGYCKCRAGYTGNACSQCASEFFRRGTACIFMPGALASCSDGVKNGHEDGVDCGGDCGAACSAQTLAATGKDAWLSRFKVQLAGCAMVVLGVVLALCLWRLHRWHKARSARKGTFLCIALLCAFIALST